MSYEACEEIVNNLLAGENPTSIFSYMMQSNSEFAAFVSKYYGKTTEEIADEFGISFD